MIYRPVYCPFKRPKVQSRENSERYCFLTGLPPNKVVPKLKQKVTSFKQGMPVITSLRNAALRTRHWEAIQNVIGTRIVRDKYFTLGHLLQLQVAVTQSLISCHTALCKG